MEAHKIVGSLQDESSEAEETSKAGAGEGDGVADTVGGEAGALSGGRDGGRWGTGTGTDGAGRVGWLRAGGGGVGVHWVRGRGSTGVALDGAGHVDWLADGARAVGDGQSGGLSDSVGLAAVGEGGCLRAEGDELSHDLGGVGDIAVGSSRSSSESKNGGDLELHVDGCCFGGRVLCSGRVWMDGWMDGMYVE